MDGTYGHDSLSGFATMVDVAVRYLMSAIELLPFLLVPKLIILCRGRFNKIWQLVWVTIIDAAVSVNALYFLCRGSLFIKDALSSLDGSLWYPLFLTILVATTIAIDIAVLSFFRLFTRRTFLLFTLVNVVVVASSIVSRIVWTPILPYHISEAFRDIFH